MALTKVQIDGVEFSDSTDLNVDSGTLVVDATNNRVGVGTTAPGEKLHISGGTDDRIVVSGSGSSGLLFQNTSGTNLFQIVYDDTATDDCFITTSHDLVFRNQEGTQGGTITERARIDSSGRLGLGTSSPGSNLTVAGGPSTFSHINGGNSDTVPVLASLDNVSVGSATYGWLFYNRSTDGNLQLARRDNSTTDSNVITILRSSGNVGIGTTSPDANSLLDVNGVINIADGNALAWGGGFSRPAIIGSNVDDNIKFNINGFEACRLDSSRRLLVGTSTSASYGAATGLFQVLGTTDAHIALKRTTDNGSQGTFTFAKSRGTVGAQTIVNSGDALGSIRFAGYDGVDYNTNAAEILCAVDGTPGANDMPGRLVFSTTADGDSSPTERMRITQSGHLKITDNTQFSNVTGAYNEINYAGSSASLLLFSRNASPSGYYYQSINADPNNTSQYAFRALQNTGVNVYTIWSNGTVSARSDARYKKNIETTRDGYLEDLSQLRVVKYNWYNHEDNAPKELGLIAQEVEEVFPGLVLTEPAQDAEGNETGEVCKSIKYSVFTPMLVKALQEAHTRIEQLEARLAALEAN